MKNAAPQDAAAPAGNSRRLWVAPAILTAVVLTAYSNSFQGAFLLDDLSFLHALSEQMREGWHWPAFGQRWVVDLTLRANFLMGADVTWGYHAVNLAVHVLAALTLYGVVRRTLRLPLLSARFGAGAEGLALTVALLWAVHPLQTAAVTYVCQRAESFMGLCYLLTLYGAVRSFTSDRPLPWQLLAVGACALGMAAKPVMVSAPLSVALYDWLLVSRSFGAALRRSPGLYAGLAACWLLLAGAMVHSPLGPSAGFGMEQVTPAAYLAVQPGVIVRYLLRVVWPDPLVFDYYGYDFPLVHSAWAIALPALAIGGLLAATLWGLCRRKAWAYPGFWFFAILAPTSSFVPLADPYFEHRLYLPLAAVAVAGALLGYESVQRRVVPARWAPVVVTVAVAALVAGTLARNHDYASAERMWRDVLVKRPANMRAEVSLGEVLVESGRREEGLTHIRRPACLHPKDARSHHVTARMLERVGEWTEAEASYRAALRCDPLRAEARCDLADLLHDRERYAAAVEEYSECLRRGAAMPRAHFGMADSFARLGLFAKAVASYQEYLKQCPEDAEGHNGLGVMWLALNRMDEARGEFEKAVRFGPAFAEARANLATTLLQLGDPAAAEAQLRAVLRLKPDLRGARLNLGRALAAQGRTPAALEQFRLELAAHADVEEARAALERLSQGRP